MANDLKARARRPGFKVMKGRKRPGLLQNMKLMPRQTIELAWVWDVT